KLSVLRNRNGAMASRISDTAVLSMAHIINEPKAMTELIKVSLYRPILFLDNSSSMNEGNRIPVLQEMVERVLYIATRLVPDDCGVLIRFINEQKDVLKSVANFESLDTLDEELAKVMYDGCTPLGTQLYKQIL